MGPAVNIIRLCVALMTLSCIVTSCKTQRWQFSTNAYDLRTAQITAEGRVNGRAVQTMLSLECRPGPGGMVGICYSIYNADTVINFNFNSFEGPYAPAFSNKLADIEVVTPHGTITLKTAVSGSYTEHNVFTFCASAMNKGKSDVRKIAEELMKGANNIIFTVHDMKNPSAHCKTNFPAMSASPVIEKTIKGCCTE